MTGIERNEVASPTVVVRAKPARSAEVRRLLVEARSDVTVEVEDDAPDCVVLVHEAPDMDALAQLAKLRAGDGTPTAAVVVIASVPDRGFRRAAFAAGAMEVIEHASYSAEALRSAVDSAIERFSALKLKTPAPPEDLSGLVASEARFRGTFEHAPIGIAHVAADGRWLAINAAFARITGYTVDELQAKSFADITHPDDVHADLASARRLMSGEIGSYVSEKRYVNKEGEPVWVKLSASLAFDVATKLPYRILVIEEIGAEKIALRERAKLLHLVEHSTDFIATADLDGRLTYMNAGGRRMLGLGSDADVGALHFTDYVPEAWRGFFRETVVRTANEHGVWEGEMQLRNLATGELVDVARSTLLVRDPETTDPWCYATVTRDITRQKATENRLRESDERYRALLESVDDGFCIIDVLFAPDGDKATDYRFVELNASFARQTGLVDAVGRTARELVPALDEFWYETYGRVALTGEGVRFVREEPALHRWFEVEALRVGAAEHRRVALLFRDITARRSAEEELRRSEARLKRMFDTNLLGIVFWDMQGGVHDANDEFLRIVGYDRVDLEAGEIDLARMTPPEHRSEDERARGELRRTGKHAPAEKEYFRKDGSRAWTLVGSAVLQDEQCVGFVLDITRQKQTEAALRASDNRAREAAARAESERAVLDAILEAAAAGIIVADARGKILRTNPANDLLWGPVPYSASVDEYGEWKGWWADQSEHRGRRIQPHEWAMARALRGEAARNDIVEIEPFDQPGTRRTMVNSGAPVRDGEGGIIGAVIVQMNISELVAAEAARRESEARFRVLADNMSQLAWMTDETGAIAWYNRRWFEFTGTTLEDMQGWGWEAVHHPDHLARVVAKYRHHLASGEPWEDTFPLRRHDGCYRWFLSRAIPVRDESGRVVSWFGTNTDVTGQREAEEALREADRRKDEFIAILAHELRNPLAPVRTAVEILRRLAPPEPKLARARDVIDRQVSHMARLIDDLLDVSRITRGKLALQKEPCDLAEIARQTAEDYRTSLDAAGLALVVVASREPVWVEGDAVRLAQMIGNLLNNASRFTEKGGRVEVRTDVDRAGQRARVQVSDCGVGIDPGMLSRLFDPFSQADQGLARSKGGLGLGLALTKGLAELHGGGVTAKSPGRGKGSTFTIDLPLSRARDEALAACESESTRRVRVLIIEDNEDAATTLQDLLELGGHAVDVALDGAGGLASARHTVPDVIISDIGLPGALDGYAVARALRAEPTFAGTLLIALSGYANEDARRRSREAGFDVHFAKPPDLGALERALQSVTPRRG